MWLWRGGRFLHGIGMGVPLLGLVLQQELATKSRGVDVHRPAFFWRNSARLCLLY